MFGLSLLIAGDRAAGTFCLPSDNCCSIAPLFLSFFSLSCVPFVYKVCTITGKEKSWQQFYSLVVYPTAECTVDFTQSRVDTASSEALFLREANRKARLIVPIMGKIESQSIGLHLGIYRLPLARADKRPNRGRFLKRPNHANCWPIDARRRRTHGHCSTVNA